MIPDNNCKVMDYLNGFDPSEPVKDYGATNIYNLGFLD